MIKKIHREDIPLDIRRKAAKGYVQELKQRLSLPNLTEQQQQKLRSQLQKTLESLRE